MKIELVRDNEDGTTNKVNVDVIRTKGKQITRLRNMLLNAGNKTSKDEGSKFLIDYLNEIKSVAVKNTSCDGKPITADWLDDFAQEEIDKITGNIGQAVMGDLDFTKLLGKSPASEQKVKET